MAADFYISADIEADGPIPGTYSMLAFGLAVAGRFDGRSFEPRDPSATTFYRELRPISENVDPEAEGFQNYGSPGKRRIPRRESEF